MSMTTSSFQAFIETLSTHSLSVQFMRDLHAHADLSLAGCLGCLRNPHERFPSASFAPRPSAPCRDGPLGFRSRYVAVDPYHALVNAAELQKPTRNSTWMENPLCKYTGLCKSFLGYCSSGSASPVPGTRFICSVDCGFLVRICSCDLQQWCILTGLFLAGSFPALCLLTALTI